MIITTTPTLSNYTIDQYFGMVSANQVVGVNIVSEFISSITDVIGGTSGTYRNKLNDLYGYVVSGLEAAASKKGANAVLGVRVDFDEISSKGKSMFMVTATGTAAKVSVDRYAIFKKLHEIKQYCDEGLITQEEYERESSAIRTHMDNVIAEESERLKNEQMRKEEQDRLFQDLLMKRAKENEEREERYKSLISAGLSDRREMDGYKVGQIIEIIDSGDCTTIDGFTNDNFILCTVDGEAQLFSINEVRQFDE